MIRIRGFFLITLIICLTASCSLYAQVKAGFTVNYPTPHCNPVNISFTNTSTGAAPLSYQWNFGINSGVNSTLPNPSTTYKDCGVFNVSLITTNGLLQSDTLTIPVNIFCKPVASLKASANAGCIPLNVQFINTSTQGTGAINSFFWDFGDGNTGKGDTVNHPYTIAGCKNVTLIVKDVNGCDADSTYGQLICVNVKPIASFTSTIANSCSAPFSITYNSTSTGKAPLTYNWLFTGGTPSTSTAINPTITYNTPGVYDVRLVVTDSAGCTDTIIQHNYAAIASHVVDVSNSATSGCAPFTFFALGLSTPTPISWSWTTTPAAVPASANSQDTSFLFTKPGNYQVCLSVTYSGGCMANKCVNVKVNTPPVAGFTVSGNVPACKPPLSLNYTNTSTGTGLSYRWFFPGGSPDSSHLANPPVILYNKCGSNGATLITTNGLGCSDTVSKAGIVNINCPSAAFLGLPNAGCAPLTVQFTNSGASGTPTFWQWNFGDTTNVDVVESSLQNPQHEYTKVGCYDVKLITGNQLGCVDTLFQKNYVCVGKPPVPNFTATPTTTCAYQTISFSGIGNPDSTLSYQWDFLHNPPFTVMSTSKSPSYLYQDTGFYGVTLVECSNGCCDTLQIDSMIHILPPKANISLETTCASPLTVTLHGGGSLGADSLIWSTPGGIPSSTSDTIITVTYPSDGSYSVQLIVQNFETGCFDTATVAVNIHRAIASFYTTDTVVCSPANVCLLNTSQNGVSFKWGVINSAGVQIFSSNQFNPCVQFTAPDFLNVYLVVTDAQGCTDSIQKTHYVTLHGLNLAFNGDHTTGCVPLTVDFAQSVTSPTSQLTSIYWDFGDTLSGVLDTSTLFNPLHVYNIPGFYNVTINTIDNFGCKGALSKPQFIIPYKPKAAFTAIDSNVCLGNQTCFFNNSTGNNLSYKWDFGDGNTSVQPNPCHTYGAVGSYTVSLDAFDNGGCADTLSKPLYIHILKTHADFSADSLFSGCPPLPVNFSNLSTGIDSATTYNWLFGDGSNSNVKNPFHIYNRPGYFNVTLITKNQFGCADTIVYDSLIVISGPSATFTVTPTTGCNPLHSCFIAKSATTISYVWDFGDGNVLQNAPDSVCYTYNNPGIFHPALILNDGHGCTFSYAIDSIVAGGPIVLWHPSALALCKSGTVVFTDSSTSISAITKRLWTFGDTASHALDSSLIQNPTHIFDTLGNYVVTLTIMNQSGCSGTFSDTVKVTPGPVVFIKTSALPACQNTNILFHDSAVSLSPIASRQWNFGDPTSGSNNISTSATLGHVYNKGGNYTVTLIVISFNGCSDSTSLPITILSNPTVSTSGNKSICPGDTTQLTSSGGVSYSWSPKTGLDNSAISNPQAFPAVPTTYLVTVTGANGCVSLDSLSVSLYKLPVITASVKGGNIICAGTSAQLNASGGISYAWQPANVLNAANLQNPVATINIATSFTVTGKDANGCTALATTSISTLPAPPANAGGNQDVCINGSVQLNGSAGDSVFWTPTTGLSNPDISNPIASPSVTITYHYVTIDTTNHCRGYDSAIVTVHNLPTIDAGNDETICLGLSKTLNASGGVKYSWSPATYLDNPNIFDPVCTPSNEIVYTVTGTDAFGCVNTDSVTISVKLPLTPQAFGDTLVCAGQPVQLNASGGTTYKWVPPNGLSDPRVADPLAAPTVTTTYSITISDSVCTTSFTLTVVVNVSQLPTANAGPDGTILAGDPYLINGSASGTFEWSPPTNLSCISCETPVATPLLTTTYTLEATNADGCRNEDEVVVNVICNDEVVYIPNAFSPNGNGKNDVFRIRTNGIKQLSYLRVYDRWGQLLFESNDVNTGWDGTFKGDLLPPAVYVYYLDAVCANGDEIRKQGNVTLVR